jgi:hypothetical protein
MNLTKLILDYAKIRGQFNYREICRYCREQGGEGKELPDFKISACLRRLKGHGYLLNKRDVWYVQSQRSSS